MLKTGHTDKNFEDELRKLSEGILRMGGLVETMIARSIESLVDRDNVKAKATIDLDHQVNRWEMVIDELCMQMLALRQPAASDLRFITVAMKLVTDIERVGDLAVNICERTIDLNEEPLLKPYIDIPAMAREVSIMIRDALDAFIGRDVDKAESVIRRDDVVDGYFEQIFRELITFMINDTSTIQRGIHLWSVAKYLERMGDHATNIAELVILMVRSKDIRHLGKLDDTFKGF